MKNKLIIIISFIIILALSGFVVIKLVNSDKKYEGSYYNVNNQTEVEVPTSDVSQTEVEVPIHDESNQTEVEVSTNTEDNQTEIEVPIYDVGQYIPEDSTIQKDITITITNLDDFDIPEQVSLENELNYFARTSNYFTESCEVELEYFKEDLDSEESAKVYLFKIKDTDVYGSFIDEAFVFDFWIE